MSSCREGRGTVVATLEEIVSRMRARKCNVLLNASCVAFIEKLSHSIAIEIAATRTMIVPLNRIKPNISRDSYQ